MFTLGWIDKQTFLTVTFKHFSIQLWHNISFVPRVRKKITQMFSLLFNRDSICFEELKKYHLYCLFGIIASVQFGACVFLQCLELHIKCF